MKTLYACIFILTLGQHFSLAQLTPADSYYVGRVKDIHPGTDNSYPEDMANLNGKLVFRATNGVNGMELWMSNGTSSGTQMVKDINPSGSSYPRDFFVFNGTLFFSAEAGLVGRELWKSDGTAAGTVKVRAINSGGPSNPTEFTVCNNTLYFAGSNTAAGRELWKTDGTSAGTVLVIDITPNGSSLGGGSYYSKLFHVSNNVLYFTIENALWRSDGTSAGTYKLYNMVVSGKPRKPTISGIVGRTIFFWTDWKSTTGTEYFALYSYNVTVSGASQIKLLTNYQHGNEPAVQLDKVLYFPLKSGTTDTRLWRSDGTAAGTYEMQHASGQTYNSVYSLVTYKSSIYFTAYYNDGSASPGYLLKSDGTAAGTTTIINKVALGLRVAGSKMFFSAGEPWVSDGTPEGTFELADINPGNPASLEDTTSFVKAGSNYYFPAFTASGGRELYKYVPCPSCPVPTGTGPIIAPAQPAPGLRMEARGNPVTNNITTKIAAVGSEKVTLTLTNSAGKILQTRVLEGNFSEFQTFDIQSYPPGMLLLNATTTRERKLLKIVKLPF